MEKALTRQATSASSPEENNQNVVHQRCLTTESLSRTAAGAASWALWFSRWVGPPVLLQGGAGCQPRAGGWEGGLVFTGLYWSLLLDSTAKVERPETGGECLPLVLSRMLWMRTGYLEILWVTSKMHS